MIPAPLNNSLPCDLNRFTTRQAAQVQNLLQTIIALFEPLPRQECATYTAMWTLLAQTSAPVNITSRQYDASVQKMLRDLTDLGLLWYDPDLRAVLQCPPFSALTTLHRIKAFGWNPTYACTFLDIPLTLLLYGPNAWLDVESTCRRSGEGLAFRVMVDNDQMLHVQSPPEAVDWRIWVPEKLPLLAGPGIRQTGAVAFYTPADVETYQHYNPDEPGEIYTLEAALYFSECLMRVYKQALHL
jgi:hypothetical protein